MHCCTEGHYINALKRRQEKQISTQQLRTLAPLLLLHGTPLHQCTEKEAGETDKHTAATHTCTAAAQLPLCRPPSHWCFTDLPLRWFLPLRTLVSVVETVRLPAPSDENME